MTYLKTSSLLYFTEIFQKLKILSIIVKFKDEMHLIQTK